MTFDWNDEKAATNIRKHDVAFELAAKVWSDPRHLVVFDRVEAGEERWHAIGLVRGVVILTVVHAYDPDGEEEPVRIISARKATPEERKRYEANDD